MGDHVLTRVGTDKKAKPLYVKSTHLVQYPSQWFATHEGEKPSIRVKETTLDLKELRLTVLGGLEKGSINCEVAKAYLVKLAKSFEEDLDSDWVSYGTIIGSKSGKVNPMSLLAETPDGKLGSDATRCSADKDETDKNVLLAILTIYRLIRVSNLQGVDSIIDNMKKQLDAPSGRTTGIISSNISKLSTHTTWQSDRDYHKLVAAYDMFFFKFPNSTLSPARFGSISSRFRDCAALLSVAHVCDTFGIQANDLPDWIYTARGGDELMNMSYEADYEESSKPYSYFPYQADMGLVNKTAYSSVANPNLFFFLHLSAALLGSSRSKMARQNTENNLENITINAIIFANAFKRNAVLSKAFTEDGTAPKEEEEGDTVPDPDKDIHSTDGSEWYDFMSKRKFRMTRDMKSLVENCKATLGATREGTIGKYIETYNLVYQLSLKIFYL